MQAQSLKRARSMTKSLPAYEPSLMEGTKQRRRSGDTQRSLSARVREYVRRSSPQPHGACGFFCCAYHAVSCVLCAQTTPELRTIRCQRVSNVPGASALCALVPPPPTADMGPPLQSFDRDSDGKLSISELAGALRQLGYHPSAAEVRGLAQMLDADGTGITYFNFLQFVHGGTPKSAGPLPVFSAPETGAASGAGAGAGAGAASGAGAKHRGLNVDGSRPPVGGSPGAQTSPPVSKPMVSLEAATASSGGTPSSRSSVNAGKQYVPSPSVLALAAKEPHPELSYAHARVALVCAAQYVVARSPSDNGSYAHIAACGRSCRLGRSGACDSAKKAALKDLIVRGDGRISAAVMVFEEDRDTAELMDTLRRIAELAV